MELVVIAMVVTAGMLMHKMYKVDKARRDKEKGFEDAAKREKRNRMRGFGGEDFWKDPEPKDKDSKDDE